MLHAVGVFIVLYGFWLLLSGYFTGFLLAAGAGNTSTVIGVPVVEHPMTSVAIGKYVPDALMVLVAVVEPLFQR